jgi:hypothetical protein
MPVCINAIRQRSELPAKAAMASEVRRIRRTGRDVFRLGKI